MHLQLNKKQKKTMCAPGSVWFLLTKPVPGKPVSARHGVYISLNCKKYQYSGTFSLIGSYKTNTVTWLCTCNNISCCLKCASMQIEAASVRPR